MTDFRQATDDELVARYIQGDNRAFDELLARYKDRIFNYILFMVKDREAADDLFQDTIVKVIVRLQEGRYKADGRFSFWLSRVAHNAVIDYFRDKASDPMVEAQDDEALCRLGRKTAVADSHEQRVAKTQALASARLLMDNLPPNQREVVYMRFYQEVPFKEIAEMTGVSIGTALGRMRYGLINMRKMVAKHGIAL